MTAYNYPHISNAADFGRVAVLMGGDSAEREISLLTGKAVHKALVERGVKAECLDARGALPHALPQVLVVLVAPEAVEHHVRDAVAQVHLEGDGGAAMASQDRQLAGV